MTADADQLNPDNKIETINSMANWHYSNCISTSYSLPSIQGRLHKAMYLVQWCYHMHPYINRKHHY